MQVNMSFIRIYRIFFTLGMLILFHNIAFLPLFGTIIIFMQMVFFF